jgi:integrase
MLRSVVEVVDAVLFGVAAEDAVVEAGGLCDGSRTQRSDLASRTLLKWNAPTHSQADPVIIRQFQFFAPFLSVTEMTALSSITIPWEAMSSYSDKYQETMVRLWPCAVSKRRTELFEEASIEMDWSARTRDSYWGTILSIMKIASIQQTAKDNNLTRVITAEAAAAPPWDMADPQQFLHPAMISTLQERIDSFPATDPLVAAFLALMLGQRVSDVLKIQTHNVMFLRSTTTSSVALRFAETKTSSKCGQFTLSIPKESKAADLLLRARAMSIQREQTYLFMRDNRDVLKSEDEIHKSLLQLWGFRVDLRALRRTGLSRIASGGAELSTVMAISRHRSIAMLERYLANGVYHGKLNQAMQEAFVNAWNHTLPTIL